MSWDVIIQYRYDNPKDINEITGELVFAASGNCWISCPNPSVARTVCIAMSNLQIESIKQKQADRLEELLKDEDDWLKRQLDERIYARIKEMLSDDDRDGHSGPT